MPHQYTNHHFHHLKVPQMADLVVVILILLVIFSCPQIILVFRSHQQR